MKDEERKPIDHEDYRIPGTNGFNFSKWSRENDPKPPARYKVGDTVILVIECEVTRVYKDCDGTTLYGFDGNLNGFCDLALLPGDKDDWKTVNNAIELAELGLRRAKPESAPADD